MELSTAIAIISALGVIGALIFNGITVRKDQKNRHYEIFVSLQKERDEIQESYPEIINLIDLKPEEVSKHPRTEQVKLRTYQWKFIQFHDKVAHLALKGIIPKNIPRYFVDTFPSALAMIDLAVDPEVVMKYTKYLQEWCIKEKLATVNDS